jgi:hypothetical protein
MGRMKLPLAPHTGRLWFNKSRYELQNSSNNFLLRYFRNESLLHQHSNTAILPRTFSVLQCPIFPQTATEMFCTTSSVSTHSSVQFTTLFHQPPLTIEYKPNHLLRNAKCTFHKYIPLWYWILCAQNIYAFLKILGFNVDYFCMEKRLTALCNEHWHRVFCAVGTGTFI